MSEPKRVQIIRPNQDIKEFIYEKKNKPDDYSYEQMLLSRDEYHEVGWKRLHTVQKLSFNDNWPITLGNAVVVGASGLIGAMITRRMAHNLLLHLTINTIPSTGACFLVVSLSHLSAYYYQVLRPMFSNDPMLCPTCLEIRSCAMATFIPIVMGTSVAVLSNLSHCLINKTIHLPQFKIAEYPEWKRFFQRHAFKGMSRRHFVVYPLLNGFIATMIFVGQHHYWKNHLQYRVEQYEKQPGYTAPQKRNRILGPVEDFLKKLFGRKAG